MLSSLLTTIQSTFGLSKSFLLGSLLPIFLFALTSGGLLYHENTGFASWVKELAGANVTLPSIVAVAALLGAGYLLSSVLPFLGELLEGKYLAWIGYLLPRTEWERFRQLQDRLDTSRRKLRELEIPAAPGAKPLYAVWQEHLQTARATGMATGAGSFPRQSAAARAVADLRRRMLNSREISFLEIHRAVVCLGWHMARNSVNRLPELAQAHLDVLETINYIRERHRSDELHWFHLRQFSFPYIARERGGNPTNVLASTRFGNISRTPRAYTLSRYGMDLDVFWTRLQRAVQADDKFNGALQDSKTQVDYLVAMCILAGLTTVIWSIWLPIYSKSVTKFLLVSIAGPLLTRAFYLMACYSQRVFADQLRSAVDLFRFTLLSQLHVALPPGSEEEVALWSSLRHAMGFGDSEAGIIYKHTP